jgi:hypothetical protein
MMGKRMPSLKRNKTAKNIEPYSKQEVCQMLGDKMSGIARYWLKLSDQQSLLERLEGMGHSIGASLDGCSLPVCGMILAPKSAGHTFASGGIEVGLANEVEKSSAHQGLMERARVFAELDAQIAVGSPIEDGEAEPNPQLDEMLARWRVASWRWEALALSGGCSEAQAMEGFALSVACVFEGAPGWPGMSLAPMTAPEDKDYHIEKGQRYFQQTLEDDPILEADVGGSIKTTWINRWKDQGEPAKMLRAALASLKERRELEEHAHAGRGVAPRLRV